MIRLKQLLTELSKSDISVLLDKIQNKQFRFIGRGDNGRVYEINDEDTVFKITTERDEFEVASRIVGKSDVFTTFIPIYYVSDQEQLFIMANAKTISVNIANQIDSFMNRYKQYARSKGGEVSIFDFLDADGTRDTGVELINFLRALQRDVSKLNIEDLELDLDFSSQNVMMWNNKMVLVDW